VRASELMIFAPEVAPRLRARRVDRPNKHQTNNVATKQIMIVLREDLLG
jgi:hypothetical protein